MSLTVELFLLFISSLLCICSTCNVCLFIYFAFPCCECVRACVESCPGGPEGMASWWCLQTALHAAQDGNKTLFQLPIESQHVCQTTNVCHPCPENCELYSRPLPQGPDQSLRRFPKKKIPTITQWRAASPLPHSHVLLVRLINDSHGIPARNKLSPPLREGKIQGSSSLLLCSQNVLS